MKCRNLKLEFSVRRWDNVELLEIATLISTLRSEYMGKISPIISKLEELREDLEKNPAFIIETRLKGNLVGWLMLYILNDTTVELNPGSILNGHPIVSPDIDFQKIGSKLIGEAINWTKENGFNKIDLTIPIEVQEYKNKEYLTLYESFGFQKKYFCMKCDLTKQKISRTMTPKGFKIKQLKNGDQKDIYKCYYDAFNAGQSRFFSQQNEEEKRNYFNSLLDLRTLNEDASLALFKGRELIGFTFVIPIFGKMNRHLNCICIHPDYGKRGLAKLLLTHTMKRVVQQGNKTMTLYTDVFNTRGLDLYQKSGFKEGGGSITYIWEY